MERKEKEPTVTLLSSDGEAFVVERKVAELSEIIKNLLDEEEANSMGPIPLFNVNSKILIKVIDYCKKNIMKELDEEWDVEHLKGDLNMLYELILASNYLHIPPLLDLTMETMASIIRGKSPYELRKIFNIKNDFTPEEEAEVLRQNGWAFGFTQEEETEVLPEDGWGILEEEAEVPREDGRALDFTPEEEAEVPREDGRALDFTPEEEAEVPRKNGRPFDPLFFGLPLFSFLLFWLVLLA